MPQSSYSQLSNAGVTNISYGSSFPDGLRVGPSLLNAQPWVDATPQNPFFQPPISQPGLNWLGNGVLLSSTTTYSISTLCGINKDVLTGSDGVASDDVAFSAISNKLTKTTATGDISGKVLTINQNPYFSSFNQVPFANIDVGNPIGYQMDWPRCVGVVYNWITGATTSPRIQVSGYDWYGNKMTEIITVTTDTPTTNKLYCALGKKAFYLVTKATVLDFPIVNNTSVQLVFGNRWGLPYRLFRTAHFLSGSYVTDITANTSIGLSGIKIGQGSIVSGSAAVSAPVPANDLFYNLSYVGGSLLSGDATNASYTTGDVRGTFDLSSITSPNLTIYNPIIASLTYYVQGANVWQNQGNILQWPDAVPGNGGSTPKVNASCTPMSSLKDIDLYGITQAFDPADFV